MTWHINDFTYGLAILHAIISFSLLLAQKMGLAPAFATHPSHCRLWQGLWGRGCVCVHVRNFPRKGAAFRPTTPTPPPPPPQSSPPQPPPQPPVSIGWVCGVGGWQGGPRRQTRTNTHTHSHLQHPARPEWQLRHTAALAPPSGRHRSAMCAGCACCCFCDVIHVTDQQYCVTMGVWAWNLVYLSCLYYTCVACVYKVTWGVHCIYRTLLLLRSMSMGLCIVLYVKTSLSILTSSVEYTATLYMCPVLVWMKWYSITCCHN